MTEINALIKEAQELGSYPSAWEIINVCYK